MLLSVIIDSKVLETLPYGRILDCKLHYEKLKKLKGRKS